MSTRQNVKRESVSGSGGLDLGISFDPLAAKGSQAHQAGAEEEQGGRFRDWGRRVGKA